MSPPPPGRTAALMLVLLTLAMLMPGTATLPLIDRDEPRFAQATVEMTERHDWVLPTFNGHDRFDKPPLTYWLMRGGYALCGIGSLGARLHSILASIALVLVTWHAGRRWFDARTGFLGAAMLATCLQIFIHGRLAVADMPMVLCVTIVCTCIGDALMGARPSVLLVGVALGAGFLAKGPIAWAVPLLALALQRWALWRRPLRWRALAPLAAGLIAVGVVAAWGIPALLETQGRFFEVGIGEHVVQRGVEKFNGRSYSPWFYVTAAPLSLFPWFGFMACAGVAIKRDWQVRTAWLVSWALAPYLIFTFYATQLPHYVLPAFPALLLLVAHGWSLSPAWARQLGAGIAVVFGLAAVVAAGWVLRADVPPEAAPLRVALLGALAVLVGLALVALVTAFRVPTARGATEQAPPDSPHEQDFERGHGIPITKLAAWFLPALLLVVGGELALAQGLRDASLALKIVPDPERLPNGTRVIALDFGEPSLVARVHRHVVFTDDSRAVLQAADQPGPLLVIFVAKEIDPVRLLRSPAAHKWKPGAHDIEESELPGVWHRTTIQGLNLGRTRWQELVVLERATNPI